MSDLIRETVLDIVSKKLGVRLREGLEDEIIAPFYTKNEQMFEKIIEEIEEELLIHLSEDDLDTITTVDDLINICEKVEEEKGEQGRTDGKK